MSAKETNLYRLRKARTAHLKWINVIKLIVSNFTIDKKSIKFIPQESEVGDWFYNEAFMFSQFNSKLILEEMQNQFEAMYDLFSKIYLIYYGEKSNSLKSFLGLNKSISKFEKEFASNCYEEIVVISDQFMNRFKRFESQLIALSEEKHEQVKIYEQQEQHTTDNTTAKIDENLYYHGPRSH